MENQPSGLMAQPQGPAEEQPTDQVMAGQQPADSAAVEGEMDAASPEEQEQYDALTEAAIGLVHGRENRDNVFNRLKNAEDLGSEIGLIAESIVSLLQSQIKQSNGDILPAVRFEILEDVVIELVEIAGESGLVPDEEALLGDLYSNGILTAMNKQGDDMALQTGGDRKQHMNNLKAIMAEQGVAENPVAAKVQEVMQGQQQPPQEQPQQQPMPQQ